MSFSLVFKDCGEKSVVSGKVHNNPIFSNSFTNVLTEGTEILSVNLLNYWLVNGRTSGPDDQLVMHIVCQKLVNGLYVRNTIHGGKKDRGTIDFSIYYGNSSDGW